MTQKKNNSSARTGTQIFRDITKDAAALKTAAEIIQSGGLVVFPTETVYGLGANALDAGAVGRIFTAKGRPSDNPLIVHVSGIDQILKAASSLPTAAKLLFEAFSPGPLTIVLPKNEQLPDIVTACLPNVAVRIPSHPAALALLKASGLPIAAPSANRSGRPSPTTFGMALEEMNGRADAIIDGGDCQIGLESTVITIIHNEVRILRPGAVTDQMIVKVLGRPFTISHAKANDSKPQSPGMKYTHYKPKAEVLLCKNLQSAVLDIRFASKSIGIIALKNHAPQIQGTLSVKEFATENDYAKGLYKAFFELDQIGCEIVLAESLEEQGIGKAIMNRLLKASGGSWADKN